MVHAFKPSFAKVPISPFPESPEWEFPTNPIVIGNDVWLGAGVTILKGSNIGDGCIVAAGAVVLRGHYPERSLIAGNPATVVKSLA